MNTSCDMLDIILVCFTEKWWDWERHGFLGRTAALASEFARSTRVRKMLVVNAPTSLISNVRSADRQLAPVTCREAREGVFVLDQTRLLPRERHHDTLFAVNGWVHDSTTVARISTAARHVGLREPVVWHSGPITMHYSAIFDPIAVAYDAVDDWAVHPGYRKIRRSVRRGYGLIRERADLVFAVTDHLAGQFRGGRPEVTVLPNGVEPRYFDTADSAPLPASLQAIPAPRVGYVGALQDRIDVELLARLSSRLPDVEFVLVGPVLDKRHFAAISRRPNVHLAGPCTPQEVPAFLRAFDVCILPHRDTPLTRSMDPVKLYEYVAAGKPVVASDLPALTQPQDLVRRAGTPDEWERQLRESLTSVHWAGSRTEEFIRQNSWEARAQMALDRMRERARSEAALSNLRGRVSA